ncbi:MAG: PHP domain-containing protein, partial [Anaerolineae bacterium]|nr:PHP domain-containing protein [Anaerolineae bacterium]
VGPGRGLKAIIGAEITLGSAGPQSSPDIAEGRNGSHLTLLAATRQGYANLCRILSAGQLAGQKGQPNLALEMLARHARGLICLSGCRRGAIPMALRRKGNANSHGGGFARARDLAVQLREIFGSERFWIEVQFQYLPADAQLVTELISLARALDIGLVATNNVHYAERSGQRLHDLLTSIRHRATLPEALGAGLLHPNSE